MSSSLITAERSPVSSASLAPQPEQAMRHPARRRLLGIAAGLALLILTLLPTMAVGAQSTYPANTVVSTYFDARYGPVAVVTDASGNLIDVNAATGQRIYPVYADYAPSYAGAYLASTYTSAYVTPAYVSANIYGSTNFAAYNGTAIYRQYTDTNSNCAGGQVTQTASGYYCTATGTPAFSVG